MTEPYGVYLVQIDKNGIRSLPQKINQSNNPTFDVAVALSGGDVSVAWSELVTESNQVFLARLHAGVWSAPLQLSYDDYYFGMPRVAADSMGGVYISWFDGTATLHHTRSLPLEQGGDAWLSQSFTVPGSMANPVLSFMASLSGVSSISGDEFNVLLSTEATTATLLTSTSPTGWDHFWFGMAPWSGEQVTLTFRLSETGNFPPGLVLLDEVTLGEGHADTRIDLLGDAPVVYPGEQFTYLLDYGNRGGVMAASTSITMTMPAWLDYVDSSLPPAIIGDQLIWQLGDLAAGAHPAPIAVTVVVDPSTPLFMPFMTQVEIRTDTPELELLNNLDQHEMYAAYRSYLSIIAR